MDYGIGVASYFIDFHHGHRVPDAHLQTGPGALRLLADQMHNVRHRKK